MVGLVPNANVAACEAAAGRGRSELGSFEADGLLPSLPPGLKVLNIRPPFFSGDGVLDPFCWLTGAGDKEGLLEDSAALLVRFDSVPELFRDCKDGRWGSGGLYRSEYPMAGIVPLPRPGGAFLSLEIVGTPWGGGGGADLTSAPGMGGALPSSTSSRLFFSASRRSTRSLHCSSSCRSDSCSARSVSDFGR